MSALSSYIQAMPKVDIHVHLEGAIRKATLKTIAEMNEIPDTLKHYQDWLGQIEKPDFKRLHELVRVIGAWVTEPTDLARIVYDVGTALHHQNIRYAEVNINPAVWSAIPLPADDFLVAINDGRDRAQRAWGIEMAWIFVTPRDEPRRADEIGRWIGSVPARRGGVVAFGLNGRESVQPVNQFERAFRAVEKRDIPRVIRAGDQQGLNGVLATLETLAPTRLYDAWGIASDPVIMQSLVDHQISIGINLTRAVKSGWVERIEDYPLRTLLDANVPVYLGSDMPTFYNTSLNNEYQQAVEKCGVSVEQLETMALNALHHSFLDDDKKAALQDHMTTQYAALREQFGIGTPTT
jgi:adenosine deaminase